MCLALQLSSAHLFPSLLLSSGRFSDQQSLSYRIRTRFSNLHAALSTRLKLPVPRDELAWQLLEWLLFDLLNPCWYFFLCISKQYCRGQQEEPSGWTVPRWGGCVGRMFGDQKEAVWVWVRGGMGLEDIKYLWGWCVFLWVVSTHNSSITHWVEMCSLAWSLYNPFPFPTETFIKWALQGPRKDLYLSQESEKGNVRSPRGVFP